MRGVANIAPERTSSSSAAAAAASGAQIDAGTMQLRANVYSIWLHWIMGLSREERDRKQKDKNDKFATKSVSFLSVCLIHIQWILKLQHRHDVARTLHSQILRCYSVSLTISFPEKTHKSFSIPKIINSNNRHHVNWLENLTSLATLRLQLTHSVRFSVAVGISPVLSLL